MLSSFAIFCGPRLTRFYCVVEIPLCRTPEKTLCLHCTGKINCWLTVYFEVVTDFPNTVFSSQKMLRGKYKKCWRPSLLVVGTLALEVGIFVARF